MRISSKSNGPCYPVWPRTLFSVFVTDKFNLLCSLYALECRFYFGRFWATYSRKNTPFADVAIENTRTYTHARGTCPNACAYLVTTIYGKVIFGAHACDHNFGVHATRLVYECLPPLLVGCPCVCTKCESMSPRIICAHAHIYYIIYFCLLHERVCVCVCRALLSVCGAENILTSG